MVAEPHELILDFLRRFDERQARFEEILRDFKQGQIAIRSDILRQERAIASVEADIDRIKVRLDLSDD
jgi:hypothetical protein